MAEPTKETPPSLLDLPPEVLLENIIPRLSSNDIFSLSRTNKLLHHLCKDPSVWRKKTETDFSFFSQQVALGSGKEDAGWFERVYLGLKKPRTYLWGAAGEGRLGSAEDIAARTRAERFSFVRKVTQPMNVSEWFNNPDAPSHPIVDLQAAGWSFSARDSQGGVWVWGKLDGTTYNYDSDWANQAAIVEEASRLPLPCKATQLATGRRHLVVLDSDNLIWEMKAWGRAYHHTARELTAPAQSGAGTATRGPYITQVSAGWDFSACLTANGDIHTWKPFEPLYSNSLTPDDQLNGPLGTKAGRKLSWGTIGANVVITMPPLPDERPDPRSDEELAAIEAKFATVEQGQDWESMSAQNKTHALRVIQIACTNGPILALRANGEVWAGTPSAGWKFLPHFSTPSITHISAQWANFFAYATSTATNPNSFVLSGWCENIEDAGPSLRPRPLTDGLQGLNIIRVVAGDWHFAALTSDGSMYTWGKNDWGQCGVPEDKIPKDVYDARDMTITKPVRVSFPPDGDRPAFVYGITAAGMHTGALVLGHPRGEDELPPIPLNRVPDHDVDNGEEAERETGYRLLPGRRFIFPHGMRIGFAGRGMYRGRGSRGGPQ